MRFPYAGKTPRFHAQTAQETPARLPNSVRVKRNSLLLVLVCLFPLGCSLLPKNAANNHKNLGTVETDKYLQHTLHASLHKREALAWLQQKDGKERIIGYVGENSGDVNTLSALRFVQDLYKQGAVKVTAIDIYFGPDVESADNLIVELPQNPSSRKKIFQVEAKFAQQFTSGPTPDEGQKLLMLQLGD